MNSFNNKQLKYKVINKCSYRYIFVFVMAFFILCEYCKPFMWLDSLMIKHILLACVMFLFGINILIKKHTFRFFSEIKTILISSFVLFSISIIFQGINGHLQLYTLSEMYYLIIPLLFCFIIFNYDKTENIDFYCNIMLFICLISFMVSRIYTGTLTIRNFIEMFNFKSLFIDSISPMIESDLSNFFLLLFIYFLYRKKNIQIILSGLGVFLGYKRFAVAFLIIIIIINIFIPKYKKVNKILFWITIILFILAPFSVFYMCNDNFAAWFYLKFGIDFNMFTMTRFDIINTVIDANLINYGLGTVTNFLEIRGIPGQTNMHNDILRIYMECTIVGSIIFTYSYFKITKNNYYSFILMFFIFTELFVAHFIGPGTTSFWILAYMIIFYFNQDTRKIHFNKGLNKNEDII